MICLFAMHPVRADWTMPGGDERNSRYLPRPFTSHYRCVWEMPVELGPAPPLVSGDRVFCLTPTRDVLALRAEDGTTLWRFSPRERFHLSAQNARRTVPVPPIVVAGGLLLTSFSQRGEGHLFAVNAETGKMVWEFVSQGSNLRRGPILSPVALAGDRLVVRTGGGLTALRTRDGGEIWNVSLDRAAASVSAVSPSLAVDGDTVYVPPNTGVAYALSLRDGKVVWAMVTKAVTGQVMGNVMRTNIQLGVAAPLVLKDRVLVADGTGMLFGLDRRIGKPLWKSSPGLVGEIAGHDREVYIATPTGLEKLDPASGKIIKDRDERGARSCILAPGCALVARDPYHSPGIELLDLHSNKKLWSDAGMAAYYGIAARPDLIVAAGIYKDGYVRPGVRSSVLRAYRPG